MLAVETAVSTPADELFETTFDLVSTALALLDDRGQLLKINSAFGELLGYSLAELLGKPLLDLLPPLDRKDLQARYSQALPGCLAGLSLELRYRCKDGSLLLGRSKLAVVNSSANGRQYLLGEIVPLETGESLDERLGQDQWLRRIVETTPGIIGTFRLAPDGQVSMPRVSPGYEEYYGVSAEELRQDAGILFERLHPADVARVRESIAESARTLRPWRCEYRVRHPRKGEIWLEGRSMPTREADGAILWFGFLHDISERKRTEQALQESEERFRLAFESAAIGMALLGLDGRWLRVNRYLCELLGRSEAELLQSSSPALTHPDDLVQEQAEIRRLLAGETPYLHLEKRYRHCDGHYLRVRLTASRVCGNDGAPLYLVAQIEDLSRLAEAEERLSLMDFALGQVHEATFLIDTQARFRYVNQEACRSLGYSREELLGMTVAEIDPDWSNDQILADWHNNPEHPAEVVESRHQTKDGRIFPVELSVTYLELGGQSYSLELTRDITERKRLQAAQRDSERRFREVFEHSSDCLYLLQVTADRRFRYIEVNAAFERSSGLSRERLIGRYLGESSVAETARKVLAQLERCLASGENVEWEGELELPAGIITIHGTLIPVRDEQGRIYRIVGISRDISERKEMETRLLTSEQQFRALAENSLNLIVRYDLNCRRTYVNPAFEREKGIPAAQALQLSLEESWRGSITAAEYQTLLRQVIATGEPLETVQEWICPQSGEVVVHAIQLIAERDADGEVVSVLAKGHNITALKRHERLEEARLAIFEKLAQGAPLSQVLTLVCQYVEQARPDFLASIMLADEDGLYLIPEPAPSLPASYLAALGRIEIGEGMGICGTAAWRGATMIAEDLRTNPYFREFRGLASAAGLLACYSAPIFDSVGKVLGTFCVYRRQPGLPTADDLRLLRQTSHLAAIAIERRRAELRLRESEQRYREIFENASDCLALLEVTDDRRFRYLEVNAAFERSSGIARPQLIGRHVGEIADTDTAHTMLLQLQECLEHGAPIQQEGEMNLSAGPTTYHSTLVPIRDERGRICRIIVISRDITERTRAERDLHAREQEFRALAENSPDVIGRFDPECRFLYANPATQAMLARPLAELLGKVSTEVSPHSAAARAFEDKLRHIVRTGWAAEDELTLDPTAQHPEADHYQIRFVPERDPHGRLVSILAVGRDISAMRAAERRLEDSHAQLRTLTSRRESAREEERKRIAREIHDELGQQLTALRMGMSLLRLRFGQEQPALVDHVQALMGRVDATIQVVRNVATSLRPSALDMGLTSALEWLVSEFSRTSGIHCRLQAPETRLGLDDARATAAFRVIQESLTNVARHAQASRVDVLVEQDRRYVRVEVRDNGKGFDPQRPRKGSLGIVGMRERGHMLGGVVTIDSTPGQGTRVRIHIPLQIKAEEP